ncbi:ribose 5-phosphate isomerase B [bacterium]|nr:ribose 5-phosphate isomerase B [candidate division CSSED10-310 bacterium]
MKVAFGCDHAGWKLKDDIFKYLLENRISVSDYGTHSSESVDYPDYAERVCRDIIDAQADMGILICGTGLGMAIAANKFKGIRAVTVCDEFSAEMARAHNDANVITFGSRVIGPGLACKILDRFLNTSYEKGRHQHRLNKIAGFESGAEKSII